MFLKASRKYCALKARISSRGGVELFQLSIYLVISAVLAMVSFHFIRPIFHSAHVTSIETVVNNLRAAAGNYDEINGSYNNISCSALQGAGLWPPNGCNGPGGGATLSDEGNPSITIGPGPNSSTNYAITISLTSTGNYGVSDFQMICNMFYNYEVSCTPSATGVNLVF